MYIYIYRQIDIDILFTSIYKTAINWRFQMSFRKPSPTHVDTSTAPRHSKTSACLNGSWIPAIGWVILNHYLCMIR